MASQLRITEEDDALARAINQEARSNPNSPYAGKYVGIMDGKVVAVEDDLESLADAMRKIDPDPLHGLFIEASADYQGPHEIWSS